MIRLLILCLVYYIGIIINGQLVYNDTISNKQQQSIQNLHERAMDGILNNSKQMLEKVADEKLSSDRLILISYLAAISQFPKNLFDSLKLLSEANNIETAAERDKNYGYLSKCFRTDFEGSMISGALQVAVDDVNADPELLPNHKLIYTFNNTCGDEQYSIFYATLGTRCKGFHRSGNELSDGSNDGSCSEFTYSILQMQG